VTGRRLLVVTPYLPPGGGGLERYAVSMASALRREYGWHVAFAASGSPGRSMTVMQRDDSTVYLLPTAFTFSNTPVHPGWIGQLRRVVRAERPDLIYAHTPVPGMAECASFAAPGVPFVLTYHLGTLAKGRFPFDQANFVYEHVVLELVARRSAHVVSSSHFVSTIHDARFRAKSSVIPPGVDTARFSGPVGPRPPRILFVGDLGRGASHKGLPDLLAALARVAGRHPGAELVVVGDGDNRAELERTAVVLGLARHVRFLGHLEGAGLTEIYRSARMLVLPSHNDNFPLVVLEAMASRLAVVATRVGAVPELVGDRERGILVEPGDVSGLAAALDLLLAEPALAERLGMAGRELVESDYTWSAQARKTELVFRQVIEAAPGRRRAGRSGRALASR
jgi:glycosyltransferase involved in cell wall biosynthesis